MNSCGFGIRALYSDRDIRHEGYNHRYPATKKTPSATLTLKLMVLLLAVTTDVVVAVPIQNVLGDCRSGMY